MRSKKFGWESITRSKLFWAVVAEALILLVGLILRPDFLRISIMELADGSRVFYGNPIDILNRSAEITIIAMGMTLVIALGGTDISVGALVAVSGAVALKFLRWDVIEYPTAGDYTIVPFVWVVVVPLVVCALMGLFNGTLIAKLKLQPIIATLILMVAGRGIAQIITNGKQFTTMYTPFKFIGNGSLLMLPLPIIIMAVIVYILTGLLAGVSGLIYSSRISSCDSNNAGQGYEMDAILAVVIGGTSMTGGKFTLAGTLIGSIVIRTITTLLLYFGVMADAMMAFKAMIIAIVIVLQSEPVRKAIAKRQSSKKANVGGELRA